MRASNPASGIMLGLLLACASAVVAQKPGEVTRFLNTEQRVDSVAGGRVFFTYTKHEDASLVGSKSSMNTNDWNVHIIMISAAPIVGDSAAGHLVYKAQCQECHTHDHGWDMREFNPPDTLVFRRGIFHVKDTTSTWNVVAYIKKLRLSADTMTLHKIPFQPGGVVVASDSLFGVQLVGSTDRWPAAITRDSLLRIDPTKLPSPLALPEWADEQSLYDWVPGANQGTGGQIPQGVQAAVQAQINAYSASPTDANALALAGALEYRSTLVSIPDAPCTYIAQYVLRYDPMKCADVGKWWALQLYLHGVRTGRVAEFARPASGHWWETGHRFHKAQQMSGQGCGVKCDLPERSKNIAGWIYLGWMWDRALNKNSLYGAGPMGDLGLRRLATFTVLRTMVERPSVGQAAFLACSDAENNAIDGFPGWFSGAQLLAYNEITRRELAGAIPAGNKAACAENIRRAQVQVGRRGGAAVQAALQPAADAAIAALNN